MLVDVKHRHSAILYVGVIILYFENDSSCSLLVDFDKLDEEVDFLVEFEEGELELFAMGEVRVLLLQHVAVEFEQHPLFAGI